MLLTQSHLIIMLGFISMLLVFFLLPFSTEMFNQTLDKWFPKSIYITNELNIIEKGQEHEFFKNGDYPDIFKKSNLILRYSLKREALAASLISTFFVFIVQVLLTSIFFNVTGNIIYHTQPYCIGIFIIDYLIFASSNITIIGTYILRLKNEILAIREAPNDHLSHRYDLYSSFHYSYYPTKNLFRENNNSKREEAKEQIANILLESRIALKSPSHREKNNSNQQSNSNEN